MKTCTKCKVEKEYSLFDKKAARKDGYQSNCKECRSIHAKGWYKNNKDKVRERTQEWRGNNQDRTNSMAREWREKNPDKQREAGRKWYKNNPDKAKSAVKEWGKNNPDKVRAFKSNRRTREKNAIGSFNGQDVLNLWDKQRGVCLCCRKKMGKTFKESKYHVDHIVPLSKGGTNWPSNIQLLCPTCNMRKHSLLPEEFAQKNGRLFI